MKKLIVLGIIVVMIAGLSVTANAAFTGVQFKLQADNQSGGGATTALTLGWGDQTATITTDGKDTAWDAVTTASPDSDNIDMVSVNPVISTTGRVNFDYRAKPSSLNTEVWSVKANIPIPDQTADVGADMGIRAWFTSAALSAPSNVKIWILDGTWTALNWQSATGSQILGSVSGGVFGSFGSPNITTRTNLHIDDGGTHMFTVVATVPEPGSLLAMFSGLIGLVGLGIRRRR